jgi:hypothetical protein
MKRLRTQLFNLLTVLSFLLFLGIGVIWVRSYMYMDFYAWVNQPPIYIQPGVGPATDAPSYMEYGVGVYSDFGEFTFWKLHDDYATGKDFNPDVAKQIISLKKLCVADYEIYSRAQSLKMQDVIAARNWAFHLRMDDHEGDGRNFHSHAISVPYWFPAALFAITPALWLKRELKWLRGRAVGRCRACGYDMRATPDRCPECGRAPSQVFKQ